jgi:hypothetical protein
MKLNTTILSRGNKDHFFYHKINTSAKSSPKLWWNNVLACPFDCPCIHLISWIFPNILQTQFLQRGNNIAFPIIIKGLENTLVGVNWGTQWEGKKVSITWKYCHYPMHITRLLELTHTSPSPGLDSSLFRTKHTHASINTPMEAKRFHLVNFLNNKRSTIGSIQIWSKSCKSAHVTLASKVH